MFSACDEAEAEMRSWTSRGRPPTPPRMPQTPHRVCGGEHTKAVQDGWVPAVPEIQTPCGEVRSRCCDGLK